MYFCFFFKGSVDAFLGNFRVISCKLVALKRVRTTTLVGFVGFRKNIASWVFHEGLLGWTRRGVQSPRLLSLTPGWQFRGLV